MDLLAIGTFFQTLGIPGAMLAVMVFLVFKIQGDGNKSETRTDAIIDKQLDFSSKQITILDKQTDLMVELGNKTEKSINSNSEGFTRMDTQQQLTIKNVDELKEQFHQLLPVVNKISTSLEQNSTNVGDLQTNVGELRNEVKAMGEVVNRIINILNDTKDGLSEANHIEATANVTINGVDSPTEIPIRG